MLAFSGDTNSKEGDSKDSDESTLLSETCIEVSGRAWLARAAPRQRGFSLRWL